MQYDWIEKAMENGGVMTASHNGRGYVVATHWPKINKYVISDHHATLPDALTSLNSDLEDDATE